MLNLNSQLLVAKIKQTLSRQKFSEWYTTGNFDKWIAGYLPTVTDEQIDKDIADLFDLNEKTI